MAIKDTAPVSAFARYVAGDIKGGAIAHAFRVETIRAALEQMFKGNYSPITEASALADGKVKKARAYHAGFATLGVIGTDSKKVDYVGALTLPANKSAREAIDSKTHHATIAFFAAFDVVMAEKAAPKEKKTPAPEAVAAVAEANEAADNEKLVSAVRAEMATEQSLVVESVIAMIRGGLLSVDQLTAIDEALIIASAPVASEVAFDHVAMH